MTKQAKARYDFVNVVAAICQDGEFWLQTDGGQDYQEYKAMPTVLEFEDRQYVKMSFNSDTGRVAYKASAPVAKIVKP
jgi:hypothetical protein